MCAVEAIKWQEEKEQQKKQIKMYGNSVVWQSCCINAFFNQWYIDWLLLTAEILSLSCRTFCCFRFLFSFISQNTHTQNRLYVLRRKKVNLLLCSLIALSLTAPASKPIYCIKCPPLSFVIPQECLCKMPHTSTHCRIHRTILEEKLLFKCSMSRVRKVCPQSWSSFLPFSFHLHRLVFFLFFFFHFVLFLHRNVGRFSNELDSQVVFIGFKQHQAPDTRQIIRKLTLKKLRKMEIMNFAFFRRNVWRTTEISCTWTWRTCADSVFLMEWLWWRSSNKTNVFCYNFALVQCECFNGSLFTIFQLA